ncbi:MAG: glycoside hydrolase family 9 protein [Chitinispirillales bacterium]|nr:glycoside hydrolase family 9 protein [Chitinispirillales bacterium]
MKKIVIMSVFLFITFMAGCQSSNEATAPKKSKDTAVYVRFNMLGYTPSRQKRMVIMSEKNIAGKEWFFVNIETGDTAQRGRLDNSIGGKSGHVPMDFNYVIDFSALNKIGKYKFVTEGVESVIISIETDPYSWLVSEPLHWMRAARCGSNDAVDHGFCHGGDKSCVVHHREGSDNGSWHDDGSGKKIDGFGGWHDAADYLKFSLTIGYATYFLLRSYEINPELFDNMKQYSKTEFNDLIDEAKWGLDWLMKTMPENDTNEFIIMVGDSEDHNAGYRLPENDEFDGKRPALSALSPHQMGYAAASLALGANIFKKLGKKDIAQKYENKSKLIFRRATSKDAVPMAALNDEVNVFYGDETVNDNLELAAAELYKLTNDDFYKTESIKYQNLARTAGWRAWESVNMPAHAVVMQWDPIAKNDLYADLDEFLTNSRRSGNIWGVPMKYVWGGLYSYIGVGSTALEFQLLTGERKYEELGRNMFDYLLGYNNWGICFVATQDPRLDGKTITDPYSQVYNLQADKFPTGAISEGPGDRISWEKFKTYFGFDVDAQRTNKFNTIDGVFFDSRKDFMCMETTIGGVADGIFMIAVASKFFAEKDEE